jgi:uncharacterized membrane protein YedE/YeeE
MRHFTLFLTGLVFGVGLIVSGMTQPAKVIGFLDFGAEWDPSLAFVMLGAIAVHALTFRRIIKRPRPVLAPKFALPTSRRIDARLLAGAALFGLGWGLAGYCPGPALVAFGSGSVPAFAFVAAMLGGMALYRQLERRVSGAAERQANLPALATNEDS